MQPIKQTQMGKGGNCLQACVASLLELPLKVVPDFVNITKDNWFQDFRIWLDQYGLDAILLNMKAKGCPNPHELTRGWYIATGHTERGIGLHSILRRIGYDEFDPHPSDSGLIDLEDMLIVTVIDPSRFIVRSPFKEVEKLTSPFKRNET